MQSQPPWGGCKRAMEVQFLHWICWMALLEFPVHLGETQLGQPTMFNAFGLSHLGCPHHTDLGMLDKHIDDWTNTLRNDKGGPKNKIYVCIYIYTYMYKLKWGVLVEIGPSLVCVFEIPKKHCTTNLSFLSFLIVNTTNSGSWEFPPRRA